MSRTARNVLWRCLIVSSSVLLLSAAQVGRAADGASAQSEATVDAMRLLERMDQAFAEQAYDGIFSFFDGNDLATLRGVHKVVE